MSSLDVALGAAPARVRAATLSKDSSRAMQKAAAWCVIAPVGPPRLWQTVTEAVGSAFEASLGEGRNGEPGLQRALGASAQALSRAQSVLVEPNLPLDAQFAGVVVSGDVAHLTVSSGVRVYRARRGEPKRLMAGGHRAPGLARGGLTVSTERLVPGDLYVFGSRDAFGMRSIGALASLLAQRPDASVADVCEAAIGPCRVAGLGVAITVLRVR